LRPQAAKNVASPAAIPPKNRRRPSGRMLSAAGSDGSAVDCSRTSVTMLLKNNGSGQTTWSLFVGLLVCWFVGLLVCWFVNQRTNQPTNEPSRTVARVTPFAGSECYICHNLAMFDQRVDRQVRSQPKTGYGQPNPHASTTNRSIQAENPMDKVKVSIEYCMK
jgi:hypothetical protein